jgi:hypothetical protein
VGAGKGGAKRVDAAEISLNNLNSLFYQGSGGIAFWVTGDCSDGVGRVVEEGFDDGAALNARCANDGDDLLGYGGEAACSSLCLVASLAVDLGLLK